MVSNSQDANPARQPAGRSANYSRLRDLFDSCVDLPEGDRLAFIERNVTDEVIDSALRYRVQAPMIDNLMKEVGIEGGSLGRMTDVLRDAKDIASLARQKGADGKQEKPGSAADRDDDRDR